MTQGDLIGSTHEVVNLGQGRDGQDKIKAGEKSDVGIVAKKFAGKAAKANETMQSRRCKPRPKRQGFV